MTTHPLRRALALVLIVGVVAACGASAPAAPVTAPEPTPVPGASGAAGGGGWSGNPGGGNPGGGNPGGGDPGQPDDPLANPGVGGPVMPEPEPSLVVPVPGVRDPHPVTPTALRVAVDDGTLVALVTWWSGVEPCTALAGVDVALDGNRYTLTVLEGSAAAPDTACIEIAVEKATLVTLGPAEPGTWTVDAGGEAGEVSITVD